MEENELSVFSISLLTRYRTILLDYNNKRFIIVNMNRPERINEPYIWWAKNFITIFGDRWDKGTFVKNNLEKHNLEYYTMEVKDV